MTDTKAQTPVSPSVTQASLLLKNKKRNSGPSWSTGLLILFFLVACVAAFGIWFQQTRFEKVGREIATQVQGLTGQVNDARRDASLALGLAQTQSIQIAKLEQVQREAKNQLEALDQVWQGANKGMEDAMLANDIDRLLAMANQQLRLSGNVNNAVITLEAALATLVRADRARFASVQRAISFDLERLRAVPLVDVPVLSKRLDDLSVLIARAPLLVPDAAAPSINANAVDVPAPAASPATAPAPAASPAEASGMPWWEGVIKSTTAWSQTALSVLGRELAELVSIQRVSDANALLLSPEQGTLLRANLRTRVLTAQMALLMNQAPVWKTELTAIDQSLLVRFDPKAPDTMLALRLVRELLSVQIAIPLPDIAGSLSALESVRSAELVPAVGR